MPQVSRGSQLWAFTTESSFGSSFIHFARRSVCQTLSSPNSLHRKRIPPTHTLLSLGHILTSLLLCMQIRHPTIQSCGSFTNAPALVEQLVPQVRNQAIRAVLGSALAQPRVLAAEPTQTEAQVGD